MTIGPEHPDHPGYQAPRDPSHQPPSQPPHQAEPAQQQWPQYGQQPGYGYGAPYSPPVPLAPMHPQATTALTMGIVGLAGTFLCGVLVVLGPFAWSIGAKAKREIRANPGQYRGENEANIGMILGIVTTVLLGLALLAIALFVVLVVIGSSSSSGDFSNA